MRLRRNYIYPLKRVAMFFASRFKPLSVHTETIYDDTVWEKVKQKVLRKEVAVWHVMTPANYNYFLSDFNEKRSKKELSNIMKERYLWMKKNGARLELHIHLSTVISRIDFEEQKKLFEEALDWMNKELDITPKEFVPGWWASNEHTQKICEEKNLTLIKEFDYDYTHDYTWIL